MPGIADLGERTKDTSTTTGTGDLTLSGTAPSGYLDFYTELGTNVRFDYVIDGGAEWEVGVGYLSGATTMVREQVLRSSNADALVNFSAGTKTVACTWRAKRAQAAVLLGQMLALSRGNFLP